MSDSFGVSLSFKFLRMSFFIGSWLQGTNSLFSYSLERAGGKFTVTPAGYILVNDEIDRETEDVHNFQVSGAKIIHAY